MSLRLISPSDAGLPYQVGSSLGTGPIPIDTRKLNLSPGALVSHSVMGFWPSVLSSYRGMVDSKCQAQAAISIRDFAILKGVWLLTAFVIPPPARAGVTRLRNLEVSHESDFGGRDWRDAKSGGLVVLTLKWPHAPDAQLIVTNRGADWV